MSLDFHRTRPLLQGCQFRELFVEHLGWEACRQKLTLRIGDRDYPLVAVAEKRGFVVWLCESTDGKLPDRATRLKLDRALSQTSFEHLIVFVPADKSCQSWLWVRREPGRPLRAITHDYSRNQPGDSLLQKLQLLFVSLDEEEAGLSVTEISGRVRAAFNVERVTKRFYEDFRKQHAAFLGFIEGIGEVADREWYASVMLNRLMFVYFIQRKGFLDGDPHYLRNRLNLCQREKGKDKFYSFYRYFLLRLFHEGLGGKQRPPELEKLLGRIPYLNGGMFDKHVMEERHGDKIQIPDKAFERIFDYFDQYQWHLDERPLRADNEINPDVLGYIFEKYINQKQMGAYYTKEDITDYIGKNAIIPFLFDAARKDCLVAFENSGGPTVWDLLRENPDRYIYAAVRHGTDKSLPAEIAAGLKDVSKRTGWNKPAPGEFALPTEIWREVVARRTRYFELRARMSGETLALTPALSPGKRGNRSPSHDKSGASSSQSAADVSPSPGGEGRGEGGRLSPITDINELITLNLDIRQFAQDVIEDCEGPDLLRAFWHAIEKLTALDLTCGSGAFLFAALNILEPLYEACLDRMKEFVADADRSGEKQRAEKLSDFREVLNRVASHPNPKYFIYKSIILNNLFGVDIMEEAVEICKLRLFLKLAAQIEPDAKKENLGIEPLPDIDFNICAGNTLVGYATLDEVQNSMFGRNYLERIQKADAQIRRFRNRQSQSGDLVEQREDKQQIRALLAEIREKLDLSLFTDYGARELTAWKKSHQPFHWYVEFNSIIQSGGFDVIIGNPPYVETSKVSEYRITNYRTTDSGNLYAFCIERAGALLSGAGLMGVIVPLSGFSTERMLTYQECVWTCFNSFALSFYSGDAHPSVLFDGVKYRLCIIIAGKTKGSGRDVRVSDYLRWYADERKNLFASKVAYTKCSFQSGFLRFAKTGTRLAEQIAVKLLAQKQTLVTYLRKTGKGHITYHRSPVFWIRSMDFEPYFKSPVKDRSTDHLKDLFFQDAALAQKAGAILNSSLFYFWFTVQGNCRNVAGPDIENFPVGNLANPELKGLLETFAELMADLKRHSKRRVYVYEEAGKVEYDEFYPDKSKRIIDEIDRVLARHYGFTAEELDFILNYDIKYRLGRDTEGEEE
jgi:hypothetical protein